MHLLKIVENTIGQLCLQLSIGKTNSYKFNCCLRVPDPEGRLPEESLAAKAMKQSFQQKGFSWVLVSDLQILLFYSSSMKNACLYNSAFFHNFFLGDMSKKFYSFHIAFMPYWQILLFIFVPLYSYYKCRSNYFSSIEPRNLLLYLELIL